MFSGLRRLLGQIEKSEKKSVMPHHAVLLAPQKNAQTRGGYRTETDVVVVEEEDYPNTPCTSECLQTKLSATPPCERTLKCKFPWP